MTTDEPGSPSVADVQVASRLTELIEASLAGDRARAQTIAAGMTAGERRAVDQLHAVVQMARIQRARGLVQ